MNHPAEHCVIDHKTQQFHCKHCGVRELPKLPMPIMDYVKATRAFVEKHKDCLIEVSHV